MSSFVTLAPERIFFIKTYKSSARSRVTPSRECFKPLAIIRTVSCKNLATSSFALSFFFNSSSCFRSFLNVVGSMFGNSFRATGKKTSMNGINTNAAKGTKRKTSAVVRVSCFRSRLDNSDPLINRQDNRDAIFTSTQSSFAPDQ